MAPMDTHLLLSIRADGKQTIPIPGPGDNSTYTVSKLLLDSVLPASLYLASSIVSVLGHVLLQNDPPQRLHLNMYDCFIALITIIEILSNSLSWVFGFYYGWWVGFRTVLNSLAEPTHPALLFIPALHPLSSDIVGSIFVALLFAFPLLLLCIASTVALQSLSRRIWALFFDSSD